VYSPGLFSEDAVSVKEVLEGPPFFSDSTDGGADLFETIIEFEARGFKRGMPIISDGTAYR
jgi:hypothetical protein